MANYCGKCGTRLDKGTGLCPNCDADKLKEKTKAPKTVSKPGPKQGTAQEPKKSLSEKDSKKKSKLERRAQKKAAKREKRLQWSTGKKVRRFFLKLILTFILLPVLAAGIAGTLVYFDVVNIPVLEQIIAQLGFGSDKSTADLYFQNLSSGFTDRKITDKESALEALEDVADVIGVENVKEELVTCEENTVSGNMYYRFHQEYEGIPVYGRSVVVAADENGNSLSLSGNYLNIQDINTIPVINEPSALEIAHQHYGKDAIISSDGLSIYSFGDSTSELTWILNARTNQTMKVCILSANSGSIIQEIDLFYRYSNQEVLDSIDVEYSINENGEILLSDGARGIKVVQINQSDAENNREIETLPLITCRADENCNEYTVGLKNLTITYDFFQNFFGLNSFDDKGGDIYLVFCDEDMNIENAMGNGHLECGYLLVGTPNELFTEPIGNALDIIGHEYTHMVAHQIVNFIKYAEQNAISEGIADVIGNLIEIHTYGVEDEVWKLGESAGYSKYSMADSVYITDFDESDEDGHNNAAIISHAAYLMWKGIDGSGAFESLNEEELAHLFYETLYTLPSDCTFEQFRTLLQNTADIMCLQGRLSNKQSRCVSNAMFQVGINQAATPVAKNHLSIEIYDIENQAYDNYTLYVRHEDNEVKYDGKYVSDYKLAFDKPGEYQLRIVDNANTDNETVVSVTAVNRGGVENLPIFTQCGVSKPYGTLGFNEEVPATGGAFNQSDLPADAVEFNDHYYYVFNIDAGTTWEEAKQYCQSQGGYLATITSPEEQAFISNLVQNQEKRSYWIGLTDEEESGNWKWVNGEPFSYSNWGQNEPNHGYGGKEHYVAIVSYDTKYDYSIFRGEWNDHTNDKDIEQFGFICEWGEYSVEPNSQSKEPVRTTSVERDIILVLDSSGSMSGTPMEETKKAATNFVNTILEEDASIGIVTYDNSASTLSDFSVNKTMLTEVISSIWDGGGTNIEAGLAKAHSMLNTSGAKKKIIVLMSDGEPNDGKEGDALISYADEIKNDGIIIYTLGFFENMHGNKSSAQYLMEHLASDGCHYEVASADDLVFFFEDMADQINGQKYIYIRIACPVDVTVTYNGETLCSAEDKLNVRTDFGTLTFEDSENERAANEEDRIKVLRLKEGVDYDVQIAGTGRGMMDYTIGFMDESVEYSDFRRFEDVKITKKTVIDTVAAVSSESVLNIDEDGDGKYDLKLRAEENGYGEEIKHVAWLYYTIGGTILIILLLIYIKIITHKKKRGTVA